MSWINNFFGNFKRGVGAFLPFRLWSPSPAFNDYTRDAYKMGVVFSNPAVLKVFALQCDLFSMAKVYVYKTNEEGVKEEIKDDPFLERMKKPNPFQTQSEFLFNVMLNYMVGNTNIYVDNKEVQPAFGKNYIYPLEPQKIDWPLELEKRKDKLVFTDGTLKDLLNTNITYKYEDGTTFVFPLRKLINIASLSNGVGNWFKGFSKIDALKKIIDNSEAALNSVNINTRFSARFLVSGKNDENDVTKAPMGKAEKEDIEKNTNNSEKGSDFDKPVHAVRSMTDIKRFIERVDGLKSLNEAYLACYFLVGNMYNIPSDVLEAYQKSATFENQEKARGGHVDYTLTPIAELLARKFEQMFGYDEQGKEIVFSWDHLPFTQAFEKERAGVQQTKATTFVLLRKSGVSLDDANEFLDTTFKEGGDNVPTTKTGTAASSQSE